MLPSTIRRRLHTPLFCNRIVLSPQPRILESCGPCITTCPTRRAWSRSLRHLILPPSMLHPDNVAQRFNAARSRACFDFHGQAPFGERISTPTTYMAGTRASLPHAALGEAILPQSGCLWVPGWEKKNQVLGGKLSEVTLARPSLYGLITLSRVSLVRY